MNRKKKIEELESKICSLKKCISSQNMQLVYSHEATEKAQIELKKAREEFEERYAKLLERYIDMMERTARINEQREAD